MIPDWTADQWAAAVSAFAAIVSAGLAAAIWRANRTLAKIAEAQDKAARPELRLEDLRLGDGDVIVDVINEGARDGAVRRMYTSRTGIDGKEERCPLALFKLKPEAGGRRDELDDFLVRSGDRRRFLAKPTAYVERLFGSEWLQSERRPGIEIWFGTEGTPATLHLVPVRGIGDERTMPLTLPDGTPVRDS